MITSGDKAMKRYLTWIVAANLVLAAGNLHAAVEVEVPGLLTDHTVSSIGHDFYRAFSDKWESEYTGNLTINEIAEDCGFNEANYFSRVFKERRGISPTDFRGEKI